MTKIYPPASSQKEEKKAKQETKRHTNQPLEKDFHQLQKQD